MAFTQSSEPAPTVAKFEFLDSASPIFISTVGPTDERLEEAARDDFAVRSVAVASSCFSGLLCSYLKKRKNLQSQPSLSNQKPLDGIYIPSLVLGFFSNYCACESCGKLLKGR